MSEQRITARIGDAGVPRQKPNASRLKDILATTYLSDGQTLEQVLKEKLRQ